MREINLNGYIDDDMWYGDEITPQSLHDELYDPEADQTEDVHIRLNSYGGSCNAATRMHDDLAAYPGRVFCTVSGTAASAATVVAMAADRLDMTPGSLWMIHNPSVVAVGDESELMDAIELLRASKESIINVYAKRCPLSRMSISDMMDKTTWMDAQVALMNGFIDNIADSAVMNESDDLDPSDCVLSRAEAEKKVQAWRDRHLSGLPLARREKKADTSGDVQPESQVIAADTAVVAASEPQNAPQYPASGADNQGNIAPEGPSDAQTVPDVGIDMPEQQETVPVPKQSASEQQEPSTAADLPEVTLEMEITVTGQRIKGVPQQDTAPESDTLAAQAPRIRAVTLEKRLDYLKHQLIGGENHE